MDTKLLEMIFKTGLGKSFKITLDNPKVDITPLETQAAMNLVISKNLFAIEGGITEVGSAQIVTTGTQAIDFV